MRALVCSQVLKEIKQAQWHILVISALGGMETRGSLELASNRASQLMNFRFSEKSYLKIKIGIEKGTGPMLTSDHLPTHPHTQDK